MLDQSELNTLIHAVNVAIKHQNDLAKLHNNTVFIRDDFSQILIKLKKLQRKVLK